ncbi:MAG TPA: ABC transporter ATP-binding protein [Candidatus Polarisedimenticolaceae bacterium]|nr:ABC transporter ATP-binding protein [Candidatus Polarisedimenticolaceae bacterium]
MAAYHFDFFRDAPKDVRVEPGDLRRIAGYLVPAWGPGVLILGCIVSGAVLGLIPPLLMRGIIDQAIPGKDRLLLTELAAGMIAIPLLTGLLGVWQNYLVTLMSQAVMLDLRTTMYARLQRQSLRFFTRTRSGEILSRVQNDVGGVQGVVAGTLVSLSTNALMVLTTLAVIFRIDWQLSLIAVAVLPLFILPTRRVGRIRSRIAKETQERLAELTAHMQEALSVSGFLLARLFGAQAHERERFGAKAVAVRDLQVRQSMAGRWFLMWILMFASIGPALIYLVGGHEAISGRLTVGTIVAFVAYLGRLYAPASALVNAHVEVMSALALFRRVFDYLDLPIEIAEPERPVRLERPRGELRFEDVALSYDEGGWSLQDVSFEARPGEMIALVGPSGAGKTSVTYLACRLYDPTAGRVTFDGVDLRELSLEDLARWTAKVTQETTLLHATIEENLRYARPQATAEELERACRLAQIHDVITALPQGYATLVGERGYKLSGGERQRLALARVALRDPRLVILDEATSSLDSRSEALIQAALEPLLDGRTSLVIAHRLSTILRADRILVLDQGRIVERGTHAQLHAAGGLYARLYEEQFRTAAV